MTGNDAPSPEDSTTNRAPPRTAGRRRDLTIDEYFAGVRSGDPAILGRAVTLVESNNAHHQRLAEELLVRLLPHIGRAVRVGITGVPGVGKSTFVDALGVRLIRDGHRVAVVAVDPSSEISGGSILGDKTRMAHLAAEPNAFIRPSPSAGTLGGVARKTRETMLVCEAAGYDVVLVETVGVGQSETMVSEMTDCFLALMLPGAGDELQGIKRGLLELVDVIAVNKADGATRSAAELAARQYQLALQSFARRPHDQPPTVLTCSALTREGIAEVWTAVEQRYEQLSVSGELDRRRRRQNLRWLWTLVDDHLRQALRENDAVRAIRNGLEAAVQRGELPPEAAARRILEAFGLATKSAE